MNSSDQRAPRPVTSLNPLFGLLKLVERVEGGYVLTVRGPQSSPLARLTVQDRRLCWIELPSGAGRRLAELVATAPAEQERLATLAASAEPAGRLASELFLQEGGVQADALQAALSRVLAENAVAFIRAMGREPLHCQLRPHPRRIDARLTVSFVQHVLGVAGLLDASSEGLADGVFRRQGSSAEVSMLFVSSAEATGLPLPLQCAGWEPESLADLQRCCRWTQQLSRWLDAASAKMASVTYDDGIWIAVQDARRLGLFRFAKHQHLARFLTQLKHQA